MPWSAARQPSMRTSGGALRATIMPATTGISSISGLATMRNVPLTCAARRTMQSVGQAEGAQHDGGHSNAGSLIAATLGESTKLTLQNQQKLERARARRNEQRSTTCPI